MSARTLGTIATMDRWRVALISGALALFFVVACSRYDSEDTPPTSDAAAPLADATVTDATSPGTLDAGDPGSCEAGAVCVLACGGARCKSCAAILAARPGAVSGAYRIASSDATTDLDVYCDMTTEGGGWIMIARSEPTNAASAKGEFGWFMSHGTPLREDEPYSLDVQRLSFLPAEILFGDRSSAQRWGEQVYYAKPPDGFLKDGQTQAIDITASRRTIRGTCAGGTMERFIGWVGATGHYFFRDTEELLIFGLGPGGWELNSEGVCNTDGLLGNEQGMIFVR